MESNSGVNRINCSNKSADLLRFQYPEISLKSRGEICIKGKGLMTCFWVNENDSNAAVSDALERVRAKQLGRMKQMPGYVVHPVSVPEQAVLPPLAENHGEGEADMKNLAGKIRARMSSPKYNPTAPGSKSRVEV